MRTLVRIHDDAYGCGFLCDDQSRLTLAANGDIACDGFSDIDDLQTIDPDPLSSIFSINEDALWVSLQLAPPNGIHVVRLMEIGDQHFERATAIIDHFATRQRARHWR